MFRKGDKADAQLAKSDKTKDAAAPRLTPAGPLASRYWQDPFSLVQEFDRYFDQLHRNMEMHFFPTASTWWASPTGDSGVSSAGPARVDLVDHGGEHVLTAELPGFEKNQISVEVTPDGVELEARRQEERSDGDEARGYLARERAYEALHRTVAFPSEVVPDKVDAELMNGVLTVRVPKAHPVEEKKTKVQIR